MAHTLLDYNGSGILIVMPENDLSADRQALNENFKALADADTGFVPYSGATGPVNLNGQNLTNVATLGAATVDAATVGGNSYADAVQNVYTRSVTVYGASSGYTIDSSGIGVTAGPCPQGDFKWTDTHSVTVTALLCMGNAGHAMAGQFSSTDSSVVAQICGGGAAFYGSGGGCNIFLCGAAQAITAVGPSSLDNGNLLTDGSGTLTAVAFVGPLTGNVSGSAASLSIAGHTGLLTMTGLTSTNRAKTVRDAADTLLELGGSYTPSGTWVFTSMTATWPTFNQNTTGSAASLTTARTIAGQSFNGTANITIATSDLSDVGGAVNTANGLLKLDATGALTIGSTGDSIRFIPDAPIYGTSIQLTTPGWTSSLYESTGFDTGSQLLFATPVATYSFGTRQDSYYGTPNALNVHDEVNGIQLIEADSTSVRIVIPVSLDNGTITTDGSGTLTVFAVTISQFISDVGLLNSIDPNNRILYASDGATPILDWSGTISPKLTTLPPIYADNAAAITGGLAAGNLYRTGADPDQLCIVH